MFNKLISLILVLCFSLIAIGQTSSDSASSVNTDSIQPLTNLGVVAYQAAPVRKKPPSGSGFFQRAGKIVSETSPDKQYVISNWMITPRLFSTQTWVELTKDGEDEPIGWVYWGEEQYPEPSQNFTLNWSGGTGAGTGAGSGE